jgi:hypothetical protein
MVQFLPHIPVFIADPLESTVGHAGQDAQVQGVVSRFPFTNPDAARSLPYPFVLRFLTVSPAVNGDQTLCETTTETGDGKGPTKQDSADDEDVTNDPDDPGTAYVIADSNDKEDADY